MKTICFSLITLLSSISFSQACNESSLVIQQTRAQDTDSNIPWELAKHYSYYNPDCDSRKILVVHMVGSYDNPTNNLLFPSFAANHGFHAISLKYPNTTAAQTACGGSAVSDCYNNFRKEIIEGVDSSPNVDVDVTNSITNRLLKLLIYLDTNFPNEGWNTYYSGTSIHWTKIIVSGHSQGGGHAAYIAKEHEVKRCLMFASPNDYSNFFSAPAPWVSQPSATPDSVYFGFNNLNDDVVDFGDQFEIWNDLGMTNFGDSLNVDLTTNFTTSHQLYTTTTGTNANDNHSLMIRDEQTPIDAFGNAVFEPVWEYMLGIDIGLTIQEQNQIYFSIYPNPANQDLHVNLSKFSNQPFKVTILNLQGQKLISANLVDLNNTLNIQSLPKGLYILKIESETGIINISKFNKID